MAVQELTFSGNTIVENDTTGAFASPEWQAGRTQDHQAPICYTRNKKIVVNAKFKVAVPACKGTESVDIRGTAQFGSAALQWTGNVAVAPGAAEVSISMTSNNPLPNEVGIFESSDVKWESNACGCGWNAAGSTRNPVYVTLGNPSGTPAYWTLLDVSCRGAAGESTAAGVIAKAFDPLRSRTLTRKRDAKGLTYWNPETTCRATNTPLLLAAPNGAGQCGSWAEFLIDMYKVHGITSADKILIVRSLSSWQGSSEGFLVKHWIFDHPPASVANAYTHRVPAQSRPGTNLPGQRNSAPPPAFFNHFIVRADGKFWDPSYGAGSFADQSAWENAAIDGLFRSPVAADPAGTSSVNGFEKSLNASTNLIQFWDLTTNTQI